MSRAGKRKGISSVKEDSVAFAVLLDKKITSLCGPSPASLASGGAEAGSDDLDLLGGSDNACANEVLSLLEATERIFEIEFRSELDAAGRERDVYQEMHEAGERERQELQGKILSLENQLRTERNKNAEELTLYDGSLAIANPQGIVTDDDRALIELGVEPVRNDALIEGGSRVTSKHKRELEVVRGQRDFLQREVEELKRRTKGAEERENARVCDMSRMADEIERLRAVLEESEEGRGGIAAELKAEKRKVAKLRERERSYEKSGREAKELGTIAVKEAEVSQGFELGPGHRLPYHHSTTYSRPATIPQRTMEKARKAVIRNRRPLIRARRSCSSIKSSWSSLRESVRREVDGCFLDLSDFVSSAFLSLTRHVSGIAEARAHLKREAAVRRKEIEELMEGRGRVRVMLRLRPGTDNCVGVGKRGDGHSVWLKKGDNYQDNYSGRFLFDGVIGEGLGSSAMSDK